MRLVSYVLADIDYETRDDEISQETQQDCISLAINTHTEIIAITMEAARTSTKTINYSVASTKEVL